MSEAFFYHLTRTGLEPLLAGLLEKSLARNWRVNLRVGDKDRLSWLDERLWSHPEDSFLPHACAGQENDSEQPVLLTCGAENANNADVLIAVDGAGVLPGEINAFQRVSIVFNGNDEAATQKARAEWAAITKAGLPARYWSQGPDGWAETASKNVGDTG